jgi:predicted Rossmann-fold nucleotide-binding protein
MKRLVVGVMGSGKDAWSELAAPLGGMIAEQGYHLLTGGGGGTMAAVTEAFSKMKKRRGLAIGIMPTHSEQEADFVVRSGYPNEWVELPIVVPLGVFNEDNADAITRNYVNVLTSDAIVVLPGEKGTANEISLAKRFSKPFILFGPEEALKHFPAEAARTDSLERVREFLAVIETELFPS